jgi:hypothetical protein
LGAKQSYVFERFVYDPIDNKDDVSMTSALRASVNLPIVGVGEAPSRAAVGTLTSGRRSHEGD